MCDKSYTDRRHLRSHLFSSHGCGEPLRCRDCGQVFKWRVSLTTHKSHCLFNKAKVDEESALRARNLKFTNLKPSDFQHRITPPLTKLSLEVLRDPPGYPASAPDPTGYPASDPAGYTGSVPDLHGGNDQSEELKEPLICIECGEVFKRTSSLLAHKVQCSQHFTPLEGPSDKRVLVTNSQPVDLSHITAEFFT